MKKKIEKNKYLIYSLLYLKVYIYNNDNSILVQ